MYRHGESPEPPKAIRRFTFNDIDRPNEIPENFAQFETDHRNDIQDPTDWQERRNFMEKFQGRNIQGPATIKTPTRFDSFLVQDAPQSREKTAHTEAREFENFPPLANGFEKFVDDELRSPFGNSDGYDEKFKKKSTSYQSAEFENFLPSFSREEIAGMITNCSFKAWGHKKWHTSFSYFGAYFKDHYNFCAFLDPPPLNAK